MNSAEHYVKWEKSQDSEGQKRSVRGRMHGKCALVCVTWLSRRAAQGHSRDLELLSLVEWVVKG